MFSKELAVKILKLLDKNNMTLEDLSEASGLSRKFITKITSGKQIPTLNSLEKLCSALEVESYVPTAHRFSAENASLFGIFRRFGNSSKMV